MNYIDIHNHCAWGIDDGMPCLEDAKVSLLQAKQDGITKIIATPHFIPGTHSKEDVIAMNERIEELRNLAKEYDVQIFEGCEIFLNDNYLEMLDSNSFNTLAGSGYTLCEFDVRKDITKNTQAEDILYEFEVRDMIPVIAHVERYFPKDIDLNIIQQWHELGYVIQVNRTSLLGMHGNQTKKNAWELITSGFAHIVASDTHRSSGQRICKLSDVYDLLEKEVGSTNAKLLCYKNPLNIIENLEIEDMKVKEKKASWLAKLKRR